MLIFLVPTIESLHFNERNQKTLIHLKFKGKVVDVKAYDFVKKYFSDPETLVAAIKKYLEMSKIQRSE